MESPYFTVEFTAGVGTTTDNVKYTINLIILIPAFTVVFG